MSSKMGRSLSFCVSVKTLESTVHDPNNLCVTNCFKLVISGIGKPILKLGSDLLIYEAMCSRP